MTSVRYWLAVVAWLVAVFVVYEALGRLVINHTPSINVDRRYGPITAANHVQLQSNEGWARNRTNELGNVDAPMPAPLPPDGLLVVGDSLTQGDQVSMAERYTDRLGERLGRRVYNAGHGSWSLVNHVAFVEAELAKYRPSTLIVQVSGNDLGEMYKRSQAHLVETPIGYDIAVPFAKNSRLHDLVMTRSAFVRRFVQRFRSVLLRKGDDGTTAAATAGHPPDALARLTYLLKRLRVAHADVVVLYLPTPDYHAGCIDMQLPARALLATSAAISGTAFVDVTEALCVDFARTREPLHGFWNTVAGEGHMNARGHEVTADVLARWLSARGGRP